MRTVDDIENLLAELEYSIADDLEDQDLDFKQWDGQSREKAVKTVVDMAVCMANGGGGTVVFGVADRVIGREKAVLGVPPEVDVNLLKKAVYTQTDPKITPVFEEMAVPEGSGRLVLMQIYPGMPPYTNTSGQGTIRVGKDCQPLTGTMRRKIAEETGETDFTAELVADIDENLLSATAFESLRSMALAERAPDDLLSLPDIELLSALGLVVKKKLTRAAIFLVGTEAAIREYIPGYNWTFLRMESDLDYGIREDKSSALVSAISRIEDLLVPFNPITTYQQGLYHFEYRTWPVVAVREALMNAFSHSDLRMAGPIMIKVFADRLEISNNGGFIGGITESNILHHKPAARNPLLVTALTPLRLINRSNLGISRMYSYMLMEGKEPPIINEIGESVTVTFRKHVLNGAFRLFVADEAEKGHILNVDELLILQRLLKQPEIDTDEAAKLCQRSENIIRDTLSVMEQHDYIEHGGKGRGTYWSVNPNLYAKLSERPVSEKRRRIDWEAAKTRILSILKERAKRGDPGLSNAEIRQITMFDRHQVQELMNELRHENPEISPPGKGRYARYEYRI